MTTNKLILAASAVALVIAGCTSHTVANKKETPAASTAQSAAKLNLAIEKYQLANGLDVVLHRDTSDPIVATAIVYHVGSNREKPGRTGFAHFFEHMLFQDSKNVGPGNFIKNLGNMGGTLNGGTWQDGTIYYEVFPKDGLEKVLWMESDRMGYFINTLTQAGLENEKQVVKNEKRQSVDNRPYGHTDYVTLKALYPEGHPYSWDVIGSLEDLQNATLQDVREFYQQWYGINNATLVLAGDFEIDQAKAWIEKYFGEFKPRDAVTPLGPMPVKLSVSKSFYHQDNFAKLPELTLTFPTVENYAEDAYALSLLADLLGDGKDSVLYKTLVEEQKLAPSVSTSADHAELAGTFGIRIRAFDGIDLDQVKSAIDSALDQFAKNGFNDSQLKRIKTSRTTDYYSKLTNVFDKAASLATHNEFAGDPQLLASEIERFQSVDRNAIMSVFERYVHNKPYIATSFIPKGQVSLALEGAIKADVVEETVVQGAEQAMEQQAANSNKQELPPLATEPSSFDRSIAPPYGEKPIVKLPDIWQNQLANGVKIYGIEHNELPLVSFSIRVMGGHSLDVQGKAGTANLMAGIMMEGTEHKTPLQLSEALGQLGVTLTFKADDEFVTLSGSTLATNFAPAMALAQEMLLTPRWDEQQWEQVKQKIIARIQQSQGNPGAIAAQVYAQLLYPDSSMMAQPVAGTVAQVNAISLADVKAFYQQNMVANLTSVHVAGAVNQAQVTAALQPLSQALAKAPITLTQGKSAQPITKPQLYFVDVPGAKQSFIRIGARAMTANAPDYYPAVAVNHNLGGSFSGQLFQILRLQKGYTYGAYSGFDLANAGGLFTASSAVRTNVTLESLQTFREILANYSKDFDQAALDNTKSVLAKATARRFETTGNLLAVLQNISSYGLSTDYVGQQQNVLANLTLEQAQTTLAKYLNPDHMIYLVVGDAATQLERLKALGIGEPILLDNNGKAL